MQIENGIPTMRPKLMPLAWLTIAALATPIVAAGCSSSSKSSTAVTSTSSTIAGLATTIAVLANTTVVADPTTIPPVATEAPTTTVEPTTTTEAPTTTTLPFVTEGAVVLVANSTNLQGGSSKMTAQLKKAGFTMADATNGAGMDEFLDVSKIYVLPGGEAVAETLARVMGGIAVLKMPVPAPINDANLGLKDATVLLMLGRDHVGKKPPNLPPS